MLVDTADVAGALSLDALRGSPAAFDERLQRARPHPGQRITARNLLRLNRASAVRDALRHLRGVLEIEMNSATDNPLVFAADGEVISGGNFHGAPVAMALDLAAIALAQLGGISERRIDRMVNPLT